MNREDLTRLSVNMNQETADALKKYADKHGVSYTEAVRRAISLLHFIEGERSTGATILIESADQKTIRKAVFL